MICRVLDVNRRSYYKWCEVGKPIANNFDSDIANLISKEHKIIKGIYRTIRLKKHIENKLKIVLNHKLIRRYKHILHLEAVKRAKKKLSFSKAREKNLVNKAPYLIEYNFKSNKFRTKLSSEVSYIKCSDRTLYLSTIKDYFNNKIVSYSTFNNNNIDLIIESYKDLKKYKNALVNIGQKSIYFSCEYVELA